MTSRRSWLPLRSPWGTAAACALAGILLFHGFGNATRGYIDTSSVFWWWALQWFNDSSDTEHGPLIVLLAVWLLHRNLRSAPVDPGAGPGAATGWAGVALAVALGLHALGYAVQQTRLSILALLLYTWGVLLLGGGPRWGRAAVFPLALLVFAIPLGVLDGWGFHLRLGVIAVTEALARLAGLDVVRSGTQLFAPDGSYQYDVAAACSGVRSLMALLALSLLIGYLRLRTFTARTAVFLLAFPLTFLGNVIRIAAVVFAGEWIGQRAGEWVHDWAGFLVFLVVLGGVQLAAGALARRERPAAAPAPTPEAAGAGSAPSAVAVGGAVLALTLAVAWFTTRIDRWDVQAQAGVRLAEDGQPADLPTFVGTDWIGQPAEVSAVEREILPADTGYARRNYVSTRDRRHQVFLSVVLSGRDRTSIHRPEICLVGQGWSIDRQSLVQLEHPAGGRVPATLLHISREAVDARGQRQRVPGLFVYWFVGRDQASPTTADRLWRTALNRLRLQPDRWAYVLAQTLVWPGEDEAAALNRVREVVTGTLPEFQPRVFVPDAALALADEAG